MPSETNIVQIRHDRRVDDERSDPNSCHAPGDLVGLEGHVDSPRHDPEPLSPTLEVPQPVGLDEPDKCVGERHRGQQPQVRVSEPCRGVDKDSWIVASGIQVKCPDDSRGEGLCVVVDEFEQPQARKQHDQALRGFEAGDDADPPGGTFCTGIRIDT